MATGNGIEVASNTGTEGQPEASEHRVWPEQSTDLFFSGGHGFVTVLHSTTQVMPFGCHGSDAVTTFK